MSACYLSTGQVEGRISDHGSCRAAKVLRSITLSPACNKGLPVDELSSHGRSNCPIPPACLEGIQAPLTPRARQEDQQPNYTAELYSKVLLNKGLKLDSYQILSPRSQVALKLNS